MLSTETRDRLLTLYRTGKYTNLSPPQLIKFYNITKQFLEINQSTLTDTQYYTLLELHFFLSLLTMNDIEAKIILDKLTDKFDTGSSEKLIVLKSYYLEATSMLGNKDKTNEQVLKFLNDSQDLMTKAALTKNATNLTTSAATSTVDKRDFSVIEKRKLSLYKTGEAGGKWYIEKLLEYLNIKPLEPDVWFELSNEYLKLNEFEKSYDCLMEVLLINPFAYNIWAKVGECEYRMSVQNNNNNPSILKNSIKHFLKSIELCELYSRGWCGLFISLKTLFESNNSMLENSNGKSKRKDINGGSLSPEETIKYQKILKIADDKLHEIVGNEMTNDVDIENIKFVLNKYGN